MLVSLWGFMGAGKSTVGREYASRFDWKHLDSDEEIERDEGCSINRIFEQCGEGHFRNLETSFLQRILHGEGHLQESCTRFLLTTGGGMPIRKENRELLKKLGTSIYIHVPFEQIVERLKSDRDRPLWDPAQIKLMNERYETRLPFYQEADYTIQAQDRTVGDIIKEIKYLLNRA